MNKKVVIFGGGTGITQLVSGLKLFPVDITLVSTVSDNGSSTGKLREEFVMPGMGDLRKIVVSLSNAPEKIKNLLEYRFDTYSDLNGHPIGNLIMVGMYNMTGSLKESIDVLSEFLDVRHKVLPISEDLLTLAGLTLDGEEILGEENITKAHKKYKKLYYKEKHHVTNDVIDAIDSADMIIFSMGSLFTSILPHLLFKEVRDAIDRSNAKILYTSNAVTQPGETDNFTVSDHIAVLNKYLGKRKIGYVLASNTKIPLDIVLKYSTSEQKDLVKIDKDIINSMGCKLYTSDMLKIENNMIRHDSLKLATLIFNCLMK